MTNKRAIIYVRVSSDRQVQGTSLDHQEAECTKFCIRNGYDIARTFREEGASAKTAERPKFVEALSFCTEKRNRIDYFVVWKIDRFARNATDHAVVKVRLKQNNVTLLSASEPVGGGSATDDLMETMLSGFAQFDNDVRTQRAIDGMSERIKGGIVPGNAPIGYVSPRCGAKGEKKKIPDTPHIDIFPILQKGLREFAQGGMTKMDLARRLRQMGLESHAKYYCTKQGIQKLLQKKRINFFAGLIWNPFDKEYYDGLHIKMITLEERDLILRNSKKHSKKQTGKIHNPLFPLRGTVLCECCKKLVTASCSTGRGGIKYPRYHCHQKQCTYVNKKIDIDVIHDSFKSILNSVSIDKTNIEQFKKELYRVWSEKNSDISNTKKGIERRIQLEQQKLDRVYDMYENNSYSAEDFERRKIAPQQEIHRLNKELSSLYQEDQKEVFISESISLLQEMGTWWENMKYVKQKKRFQSFVFPEGITYYRNDSFGTAISSYLLMLFSGLETNKSLVVDVMGRS